MGNPLTLSSPEQFQETLKQWRKELTTYSTHLSSSSALSEDTSSCNNADRRGNIFLVPPFSRLDKSLKRSVTELVTMTLQNSVAPNDTPDFINSYKTLLDIIQIKDFIGSLDFQRMRECWVSLICDDEYLQQLSSVFSATHEDDLDKIKDFIIKVPLAGPGLLQRYFMV